VNQASEHHVWHTTRCTSKCATRFFMIAKAQRCGTYLSNVVKNAFHPLIQRFTRECAPCTSGNINCKLSLAAACPARTRPLGTLDNTGGGSVRVKLSKTVACRIMWKLSFTSQHCNRGGRVTVVKRNWNKFQCC